MTRTNRQSRRCVCNSPELKEFVFPNVWSELRSAHQLCDGSVVSAEAREFPIHRAILCAVSPYFKALFTNSININHEELKSANTDIPALILETLLDFAYTGKCTINRDNVQNLLRYADQYDVMGVVKLCCNFLMDQLCPTNCLSILNCADQFFCAQLMEKAKLYVKQHFPEVLSESAEFSDIKLSELIDILRDDELNVKSEEIVYQAIKKWIGFIPSKRKAHLGLLLKCIRLYNLMPHQIIKMSRWSLIQKDLQCKAYMHDIQRLAFQFHIENLDYHCQDYYFRPRIPYEVLFAVGGWSAGSPTNFIEVYDNRADRWLLCTDTDATPRAYHGLCSLRGLIYMIGGFDGHVYYSAVRCFNPVTRTWSECACMNYQRCYVSVVVHDDRIYAIGGYNGRRRMNTVERYNPDTNQWQVIAPMLRQRSDAGAAVLNSKIYVVGGFNGQEVMCSGEVFDIATNQWSFISSMNSPRSGVSLVAYKDTLYAIAGFNGYVRLRSSEKMCPDVSDEWTGIKDMVTPRSNFATTVLDNLIYVIGGFDDVLPPGSTTINHVQHYNPEADQWMNAASMNLNRSALNVTVLRGLPNNKEYSYLGRLLRNEENEETGKPIENYPFESF